MEIDNLREMSIEQYDDLLSELLYEGHNTEIYAIMDMIDAYLALPKGSAFHCHDAGYSFNDPVKDRLYIYARKGHMSTCNVVDRWE